MLIIGAVLLAFGLGAMLMMRLIPAFHAFWPAPLPVAFIGGGLIFAFFACSRDNLEY